MSKQLGVHVSSLEPIRKAGVKQTVSLPKMQQPSSMQTIAKPHGQSKQLDVPIHDDDFIGGIRGFRTTLNDRTHSSHQEMSRGAQAESRLGMVRSSDGQQFDVQEFI